MPRPRVYLLEDDQVCLRWMDQVLSEAGYQCLLYSRTEDFLSERDVHEAGCAVVDFFLEDGTGQTIQEELNRRDDPLPLIMMSGGSDIPIAVKSMQLGARNFLVKPFSAEALLENVRHGLEEDARRREERERRDKRQAMLDQLTEREQEVLRRLLAGDPNKAIAYDMKLSERTIEYHRSQIMNKLQAKSIAELVRLVCAGDSALDEKLLPRNE